MNDHFDGTRFFLTGHTSSARFRDLLKWQMNGRRSRWPKRVANGDYPRPPQRVEGSRLLATWIGQATVLIQTAGLNILTDPFFSPRASPFKYAGPRRARPPGVALQDLPPIDVILVSHNHYDHMDVPALAKLAQRGVVQVVTPLGNRRYMHKAMAGAAITELDWHHSFALGAVRITLMPALHWSKRRLSDANTALWGAFVIDAGSGPIYFAGDTGFGEGNTFREVLERHGVPRLSLLPIGAYEPRWFMKSQHMNPEEAVAAHQLLSSRTSIGIHHSTIQLTDEAIDAPVLALRAAAAAAGLAGKAFLAPEAGEPREIA